MSEKPVNYRCQRCLAPFQLKKEIETHIGTEKLTCTPHDGYNLTDKVCKTQSLIKIPRNTIENRTCKICDTVFSNVHNYKRHHREQHTDRFAGFKNLKNKQKMIMDGKTNISNNPYVITTCRQEIDPETGVINNYIDNTTNTTTLRLIFEVRLDGEYHDTYIYTRKYINGIIVEDEEDVLTKIVFEMVIEILMEKGIDIFNIQSFVDRVNDEVKIQSDSTTNNHNITLGNFNFNS